MAGSQILHKDLTGPDLHPPGPHTHVEADITNLDKYTQAQTDALLDGLLAEITAGYYTQAQANSLLDNKSNVGHTHIASNITDFSTAADARIAAQKGVATGIASLDSSGKIPTSQLPGLALTTTFVVGSEGAMLSLSAVTGNIAVRTDLNKTYILAGSDPSVLANWQELLAGANAVNSVNGQTGTVVLTTSNISEGSNLYHTTARVQAIGDVRYLQLSNNLSDIGSASTARTNLGLGSIATQNSASVSITGGSVTGITDLAIADGGTGAGTASVARTNLGLAIGINVQAYDPTLDALSAFNSNGFLVQTAADTFVSRSLTAASSKVSLVNASGLSGNPIIDVVEANLTLSNLGGVLTIAQGGTNAVTAANARSNLGVVSVAGDTMTGLLQFVGIGHAGLQLNSLTTTQRNLLTPAAGMLIYNSTATQTQKYENGQWVDVAKSAATKVVAPSGSGYAADYYTTGANDDVIINLATAFGGKTVLKAGSYYISNDILVKTGGWVDGEGMGATTVFQAANKGFKNYNHTTTGDVNVRVSNLTIDGQNAHDQSIQFAGVQWGVMENLEVKNVPFSTPTVAVGIIGLSGVVTSNIQIRNCFLHDIADYGINVDPLSTFEVIKDIQIIGNSFSNVETGMALQKNPQNTLVAYNIYDFPGGQCIGIKAGPGSDATHIQLGTIIENNIFVNADQTTTSQAISVGNYCYRAKVAGNKITNFETAIYQNIHPLYTSITDNHIEGSTYGIRDVSGGEYAQINDNYIFGCGIYGIWYNSPADSLSGNVVAYSGQHGMYLQSGADGSVVSHNKCYDNGTSAANTYDGIMIENVTGAIFIGNESTNRSTSNQKYGIEEAGVSNNNTYIGNDCNGNATGKLNLLGAANSVSNNRGYTFDSNKTIQSPNVALSNGVLTGQIMAFTTDSSAINKGAMIILGGNNNAAGTQTNFASIAGRKETGTAGNTRGYLQLAANGFEGARLDSNLRFGVGVTSVTAYMHLHAGQATAGFAPLKFNAGTNLTTTEAGAIEYDGSHLYFTAINGGTRFQLDQQLAGSAVASLTGTANQVLVNGTSGAATTGAVTLTLPQDIGTGSTPTFAGLTITGISGVLKASAGALAGSAVLNDIGAATGDYSLNSHKITNLLDPVSAQDAATKNYVDTVAQGLSPKPSAVVATTAGLPAYSYSTGVITATAAGTLTIDGHLVALNEYVLVKNETSTNAPYNGLYKCTTAGAVGVAYVLTRAIEMDSATEFVGSFVFVESGTVNASSGWVCTDTGTIVVGTTNIAFTQFSGAGEITAGTGLTKTANTLATVQDISTGASPVFAGLTTSGLTVTGQAIVSSSAGGAFSVGQNGSTNPAFNIDASTATSRTGFNIKSADAAAGLAISVISSGTNESMTIDAKGTGTVSLGSVSTGNIIISTLQLTNALAVGYGGTGQTTYTDGQLLIGNSSGNTLTKASLTGTANQITVTNGNGSITLSTPQNIHTGASPTFVGLTLSGATVMTSASAANVIPLTINQNDTTNNPVAMKIVNTGSGLSLDIQMPNVAIGSGAAAGMVRIMSTDAEAQDKGGSLILGGYDDTGQTTIVPFATISGRKENGTTANTRGYMQFATNGVERARFDSRGNFFHNTAAVATNATDGFLYIPSCAGAPTGTPTGKTGLVPMVYDSTNNNFYFYNSGWKKTTVFA